MDNTKKYCLFFNGLAPGTSRVFMNDSVIEFGSTVLTDNEVFAKEMIKNKKAVLVKSDIHLEELNSYVENYKLLKRGEINNA